MQRTLKRELKVLEIVYRETMVTSASGASVDQLRRVRWYGARWSGVLPTHVHPPGGHGGVHSAHVPVVVCSDEVSAEWPIAGGPTRRLSGGGQMPRLLGHRQWGGSSVANLGLWVPVVVDCMQCAIVGALTAWVDLPSPYRPRNGHHRPVLKHGPRSLTYVRV